ncbi:MAG TPA: fibronectin type III domain-containing protein [Segeticoccus sp.]|uniref:fibronectin type III domain-containing protein n=1 Tax=Segeticoccus sp. TaxID=2706531 RepID=UPI002D80C629|nr:fibronectin type III domain-containing protein [Segeticoccus sp.]HET8598698.1 fibronectin type III domain-containing protein [Segeticoccus sp.]
MKRAAIVSGLAVGALAVSGASAAFASTASTPRACAHPDGRVSAVAFSGTTAYLGGSFTKVTDRSGSAQPRAGLAAVDTATCDLLPWTASADGAVAALTVSGNTLYVGGAFTHVNSAARSYLAAVSTANGSLQAFAPTLDQPVRALDSTSSTVFAGGAFTQVNGSARGYLASFSTANGALTGWAPKTNKAVDAVKVAAGGANVYIGGAFTSVNGAKGVPRLAAVDSGTGALASGFKPPTQFPVHAIDADGSGVYVGTGGPGGHLLVLNLDGSLKWPIYQTDGGVQAVAVSGDSIYAGGHFSNYCVGNTGGGKPFVCDTNLKRSKFLEVSQSTGKVTDWAPTLNSAMGVTAARVHTATGDLWAGGDFTSVNGDKTQAKLAVFPGTGGTPPPTQTVPGAPTGLGATGGDGLVNLSWQPPSSNGGAAITGYNVYRASGSGSLAKLASATGTAYTDKAVTNGTTYSYVVKAVNSVGEGTASSTVTATPAAGSTPPPPPSSGSGPCGTKVGQTPVINHVVMLIFENKARSQVMGQSYAPYLNSLADKCGQATNMQALSNTSLANYIALTSGYTGHPTEITANKAPSVWPQDSISIFEQLGTQSRELSEDAGGNCWTSNKPTTFTVTHTPFPYYTRTAALCKTQDVPLGSTPDLSAKFTLVTPNKAHIMHRDPSQPNLTTAQKVAIGDQWASTFVPKVLASPQYQAGDTVLIIGFDEGNSRTFNIPFIVVSPYTPVGYTTSVRLDHYSTLKGVQQMLNLSLLGNAATSTTSIRDYFGLK